MELNVERLGFFFRTVGMLIKHIKNIINKEL